MVGSVRGTVRMGGEVARVPHRRVGGGELAMIVQLDVDGGLFLGVEVEDGFGGGVAGVFPAARQGQQAAAGQQAQEEVSFFMGDSFP